MASEAAKLATLEEDFFEKEEQGEGAAAGPQHARAADDDAEPGGAAGDFGPGNGSGAEPERAADEGAGNH